MRKAELLRRIQDLGGIASAERAELVLRAVMDALKAEMTPAQVKQVAGYVPEELREDWVSEMGHPAGILEKEGIMFEPAVKR